jgi:hypothetical protein
MLIQQSKQRLRQFKTHLIGANNPEDLWKGFIYRNLRSRRRMHLFMQDDQIGQKFTGLAQADMARLAHLINTNKIVFSSKGPIP